MPRIRCDVHTHTLFSRHAYSTLEENVRAAAETGMELLGSADHLGSMLVPNTPFTGSGSIESYQFFVNQRIWPRDWHGVRLLRGVEIDIVDLEGHLFGHGWPIPHKVTGDDYPTELDLDERCLLNLDYAIASIHGKRFLEGATRAQVTRMYIGALENPKVLILGHIARSGLDFELDPVIEAARDLHKLIEINELTLQAHPGKVDRLREVAARCAELGCAVSTGTDAHISTQLGLFAKTEALFEELGFPEELVATSSARRFLAAVEKAAIPGPGTLR